MGDQLSSSAKAPVAPSRTARLILFALWLAVVLYLAWQHVPWRDEVRALTIALAGDNVDDMLRGLQGEGHPALWYLLLRGAYMIVPVPQVMIALSVLIGAAAALILVLKSPFRLLTLALILFGALALHEFTVVARNYGMSMLVLFAIAALYPRYRDRGVVIGLLLALLCNTNVPAALLAAALLGFWLVELVCEEGLRWTCKHNLWIANVGVAIVGVILCFVLVYPPAHDAAQASVQDHWALGSIASAITVPMYNFASLLPPPLIFEGWPSIVLTILMFGTIAGLANRPAALLTALGLYLALSLFFHLVYPAYYRHSGLFLVFVITLYWLAASGRGGAWRGQSDGGSLARISRVGGFAFTGLLAVQVITSVWLIVRQFEGVVWSRAYDVAKLLERENLTDAVILADEDIMVEPLPYYIDNALWLPRERRYGAVFAFDRHPRNDISLDDILGDARALHAETRRPIVLLMSSRPSPDDPPMRFRMLQTASFTMTPEMVARFQAETRQLASFGLALTGETYDVYRYPAD